MSMTLSILQDAMPPPSPDHPASAARFRPYASPKHTVTTGRYITSNDPRGYVPVYEYSLNGQWLMVDSDNGYVLWTGIWKALGNTKADVMKMVESQPELAPQIRRVRGGYLKIQGTWMPYEVALRLARRVAWPIREDLIPLFGPTFPSTCLTPDQPGYGQLVNSSGRRKSRRMANPNPLMGALAQPQQQKQHVQDHPKHAQPAQAESLGAVQYEARLGHAYRGVSSANTQAASAGGFHLPNTRCDQIPASTQSSSSHPQVPYAADAHTEAPSAAYMHSYPQLQNYPVPQTPYDQVQTHADAQTDAGSHLGSRYTSIPPSSSVAQEYRNTPSYPQQSDRKRDDGTRQEHHRQQRYSPYPSPTDRHAHGHHHTHGLPQNPDATPRARPIENPVSNSPRILHTPLIAHLPPYLTRDRERDGPIHLPPLSSLGPPLLPPLPIQTAFGGGLPNGIRSPSDVHSKATNAAPATYSLPPISSLDSPGSGTGVDGSSAVLRRLKLDDEHVHMHRRDLNAHAHRVAHSESGFTLPSPQELRRRRSISAPPFNAYGGGGLSTSNSMSREIEPERDSINPSQSRGLQSVSHIPRHDPGPRCFGYSNSYAPASHYVPQHEQLRAPSEAQSLPHYSYPYPQPRPRSPLLAQPVYHGTGAPQWPTPLSFPPSSSGPGSSYLNEVPARASGSSTHHTHASWARPSVPADVEKKAVSPTRMPSRPW